MRSIAILGFIAGFFVILHRLIAIVCIYTLILSLRTTFSSFPRRHIALFLVHYDAVSEMRISLFQGIKKLQQVWFLNLLQWVFPLVS